MSICSHVPPALWTKNEIITNFSNVQIYSEAQNCQYICLSYEILHVNGVAVYVKPCYNNITFSVCMRENMSSLNLSTQSRKTKQNKTKHTNKKPQNTGTTYIDTKYFCRQLADNYTAVVCTCKISSVQRDWKLLFVDVEIQNGSTKPCTAAPQYGKVHWFLEQGSYRTGKDSTGILSPWSTAMIRSVSMFKEPVTVDAHDYKWRQIVPREDMTDDSDLKCCFVIKPQLINSLMHSDAYMRQLTGLPLVDQVPVRLPEPILSYDQHISGIGINTQ